MTRGAPKRKEGAAGDGIFILTKENMQLNQDTPLPLAYQWTCGAYGKAGAAHGELWAGAPALFVPSQGLTR